LIRRHYISKEVFFEVYNDGLVILKVKGKEIARKVLNPAVANSQIERAFWMEVESLRARRILPSPYGFKAYYKPSLDKIVLRSPFSRRKKGKRSKTQKLSST
jgi:hypothetical protein